MILEAMDLLRVEAALLRAQLPELVLRPGMTLPARVMERHGQMGLLLLAGTPLAAQLPDELKAGGPLRLRGRDVGEQIVLRPVESPASAAEQAQQTPPPEVALPLPGGRQAEIRVTEQAAERRGDDEPVTVALDYDSPALGTLDLRLVQQPGGAGIQVTVGAMAGAPEERGAGAARGVGGAAGGAGPRGGRGAAGGARRRDRPARDRARRRPDAAPAGELLCLRTRRHRSGPRRCATSRARRPLRWWPPAAARSRARSWTRPRRPGSRFAGTRHWSRRSRSSTSGGPSRPSCTSRWPRRSCGPTGSTRRRRRAGRYAGRYATSRKSASSSESDVRSERLSSVWIWQTRLSETPRTSPISRSVSSLT